MLYGGAKRNCDARLASSRLAPAEHLLLIHERDLYIYEQIGRLVRRKVIVRWSLNP